MRSFRSLKNPITRVIDDHKKGKVKSQAYIKREMSRVSMQVARFEGGELRVDYPYIS